jgi:hypothetical protein
MFAGGFAAIASGALPTAIVLVTFRLSVSTTDTLLPPRFTTKALWAAGFTTIWPGSLPTFTVLSGAIAAETGATAAQIIAIAMNHRAGQRVGVFALPINS